MKDKVIWFLYLIVTIIELFCFILESCLFSSDPIRNHLTKTMKQHKSFWTNATLHQNKTAHHPTERFRFPHLLLFSHFWNNFLGLLKKQAAELIKHEVKWHFLVPQLHEFQ